LERIGLTAHKASLSCLFLLYRRPDEFVDELSRLSSAQKIRTALVLSLHALPYVVVLAVLGRLLLQLACGVYEPGVSYVSSKALRDNLAGVFLGLARGVVVGLAGGIAVGAAVTAFKGMSSGMASGLSVGIAAELIFATAAATTSRTMALSPTTLTVAVLSVVAGVVGGVTVGVAVGAIGGMKYGFAEGITVLVAFALGGGAILWVAAGILGAKTSWALIGVAAGIASAIAGGLGGTLAGGLAYGAVSMVGFSVAVNATAGLIVGMASTACTLRLYYYPAHLLFVWPVPRGKWYRYHPVAWDNMCSIGFLGLDTLLVAFSEVSQDGGLAEIDRLIAIYRSQRALALRARVILLARNAGAVLDLSRLSAIVTRLPEGDTGFLHQTARVREWVGEIVRIQIRLNTIERAVLREPTAQVLCTEIENFQHRIAGFEEPLPSEFRAAAERWKDIANRQLREARAVVSAEPFPQVFRAGDPVDRDREAFVSRSRVVGELEGQISLSTGCPGIVLYGRRRVGKSTVLKNLTGFLPNNVTTVVISMQEPRAFTSLSSFVRLLCERIGSPATESFLAEASLTVMYSQMAALDLRLTTENRRMIVALDEYEIVDSKIASNTFTEDLLRTIRESVQTHRSITWIFAGSHQLAELKHAPWTSYLVSARTIEVPAFTLDETRLLVTEPLRFSSLWHDESFRPRFSLEFWGDGGIERIHNESDGWPHLVQLVAETVVDLVNEAGVPRVDDNLFDRALSVAIVRGENVFYELMRGESTLDGEWEYLCGFVGHDQQPPSADVAVRAALNRRQIVRTDNNVCRLRVPMMARWLRERAF